MRLRRSRNPSPPVLQLWICFFVGGVITSFVCVVVGIEPRTPNAGSEEEPVVIREEGSLSYDKFSTTTSSPPHSYKTVSPDDDEVHDDEIIEAVRNSLRLWKEGKLNKSHHHHPSRNRVKRDEEVVCYGPELGCFRDEGPFDYLDMLPSTPEEIGTKFLLYAKDTEPEVYSFFNHSKISSTTDNWNASRPTKVIIHGFGSTCLRMWANEMRAALLSVAPVNVICVDWENGAQLPNYVRAAVNTRLVGKQLSVVIRRLVADTGGLSSYNDFHLIGFSLGAHVAGFTGQELRNISRITGLDPAGPLFENYDKRVRLDSTDAVFVDVIHSNGDSLLMGGLGSWEPIGHLDFYPNGGRVQKGCSNLFLGAFRDFIWSAPTKEPPPNANPDNRSGKSLSTVENDGRSLCNHRRAYRFFTESVSPRCAYPAFSCETYEKFLTGACFQWDNTLVHSAHMGYYADQHQNNPRMARVLQQHQQQQPQAPTSLTIPAIPSPPHKPNGKNFYLITRDDEPFCANQYKIILESSPPLGVPISTYGGVEAIVINANDDFNETHLITQTHKDNMIAGSVLQRLIVAHPALSDPGKVVLKYTAYKGWIYSGISRWSLDRLIITNAFGISYSFCARGLLLPSGVSVTVTLTKGICTVTNYPFRYPHIHPHMSPSPFIPGPHNNNPNIGPTPPLFRNEINDTSSSSLPPTEASSSSSISEIIALKPTFSSSSLSSSSSYPDWTSDWQPIIINKTRIEDCTGNNCTGEVDNEIDNGGNAAERRSRQLAPVLFLPLSRGIEPRPVILRTSRHMILPSDPSSLDGGPLPPPPLPPLVPPQPHHTRLVVSPHPSLHHHHNPPPTIQSQSQSLPHHLSLLSVMEGSSSSS